MEIQPASLAQVRKGRDGRNILITDDVSSVARDLHEIDPKLRVRFSEGGGHYAVYFQYPDGREELVLTAQKLDQRIVKRFREIADESYDFGAEVERIDRQAERDQDARFSEQVAERGERLAHALRQDLGVKRRIHVPKEIPSARS